MTVAVANELVELAHDLARAVSEHDVDRLERLLASEFTLQGAAGQLDRAAFLEAAAGPYEIDEFTYEEIDPEVYGNTAVLVSRYHQVARLDGRDLTHRMHVTDIWTRREARWQIVRQARDRGGRMSAHATPAELEAGLDTVREAPTDRGTLELVVVRPEVGEREVLDEATLDLDDGVVGDRWRNAGRSGGRPANVNAQVTLMSARAAALVAGDRERWPLAGDQLYVDLDLSGENLPPGTRLGIGSAVLEVTDEPHTGCKKFTERFGLGRDGLRQLARGPRAQPARDQHARRRGRHRPRRRRRHEALTDPGRAPRGVVASCPHAAAMSRPRVRRTVAGTRPRSSSALKRAIASRDEPSKRPVGL